MAELKVLNDAGQQSSTVQAPDTLFAREYNEALVHQVVVAYQANARQGTRAQKDRTLVKHTTRKPWRQKGTGRARAGMSSSPLWRGGGRIFPNSPDENFSQKVNRKMYRAGIAAILSQLAREDRVAVVIPEGAFDAVFGGGLISGEPAACISACNNCSNWRNLLSDKVFSAGINRCNNCTFCRASRLATLSHS
mgnify:CR=1 FL=1